MTYMVHPRRAGAAPVRSTQANGGADVVELHPRRRRGRPPKPSLAARPCTDSFETVAAAVVGVAQGKSWVASKERVRHWTDRERGFSPSALKALGYLLEHINRGKGFDWHAAETIAAELGLGVRTVERAFSELTRAGAILPDQRNRDGQQGQQALADDDTEADRREPGDRRRARGRTRQEIGEAPAKKIRSCRRLLSACWRAYVAAARSLTASGPRPLACATDTRHRS